jgi:uncharacterized membrane protein (UPF0127 family)
MPGSSGALPSQLPPCGASLIEIAPHIRHIAGVKFAFIFPLLLAAAAVAGCGKSDVPELKKLTLEDFMPKEAQSKLQTMKIYLGAETLDAELALSQREQMTGMMYRTNIQETDAMLFVLPYTQRAKFWMYHCPESISAAYINPDGVIEDIHHLEKNDTNSVLSASENIRFVLETKEGWFTRHNIAPGTVVRTEKGSLAETFLGGR